MGITSNALKVQFFNSLYRISIWPVASTLTWCIIKWKHFPRYWPFVRGIHRSPVNSPHKRQWRGALMFSLICTRINGWVNNGEAGDWRRHRAHYDIIVMISDERSRSPLIKKSTLVHGLVGVPSDNKPLSQPTLVQIDVAIWRHWTTMS